MTSQPFTPNPPALSHQRRNARAEQNQRSIAAAALDVLAISVTVADGRAPSLLSRSKSNPYGTRSCRRMVQ
jgi:hypothetical protein